MEFKTVHEEIPEEKPTELRPPFLWVQEAAGPDEDIRGLPCAVVVDGGERYPVIRTLELATGWCADRKLARIAEGSLVTLALTPETARHVIAIARQAEISGRTHAICITRTKLGVSEEEEDCPAVTP